MIRFFNDLSIRKKLLAATTVCALGIGIFITAFFSYHMKQQILYIARQASLQVVGFAAASIRNDLANGDAAEVQKKINDMQRNPSLRFAVVYDATGRSVAAINAVVAERMLARYGWPREGFSLQDEQAFISAPVLYRGTTLGTLIVCVSIHRIFTLIERTAQIAAAVSIGIIALLLLFFWFIGTVITRPVNRLIEAATYIARGDFSRKLAVSSRDEIGKLSRAFNEMSQRLEIIVGALERSEHNYRLHFENISDLLYAVNPDLTIASMSPSIETLLGYAPAELCGTLITQARFIAPEAAASFEQNLRRAFGGERIASAEYMFAAVDGTRRFFETSFSPLVEDNAVSAVVCVSRDITERRRALQELREARDFLDNVIENSQDAIIACDSHAHITLVNRYCLSMFQCTDESEIMGQHLTIFLPPGIGTYTTTAGDTVVLGDAYFTETYEHVGRVYEAGAIRNWQTYMYTRRGLIVPVEINITVIKTAAGEAAGSVGIMRDITERRKAERQIKEAKEFMESLIESSRDGIMITNLQGEILSVNKAMERITGLPREAFVGKHSSMLSVDDREMRRVVNEYISELMDKGFITFESFFKTPQGKYVELECNSALVRDAAGTYTAGVTIVRDVTERKAMERQLVQSEKLRSLGELASGVAHDFNNVLAAILGRAQLLQKLLERPGKKPERRASFDEVRKGLKIIEKAALDAAETVRRIQEFSRTRDEDRLFTALNVNEIIADAIEFTRSFWKDAPEARGIKVRISKRDTPLPPVRGSATELREVFINLIKNAVEAMPGGGDIVIQTAAEPQHVLITVKDTGVGIPEEHRTKIFDPFFTTKGPQSSGLGMSVSYGIINRHQGTITFETEPGRGTTFLIRLPVARTAAAAQPAPQPPVAPQKASVLVIDDEQDVRDTMLEILREGGHAAVAASSGTQGLKLFAQQSFDMVFTDLGMPGLSGYQVAEQIKKADPTVPVALITGWQVHLNNQQLAENGVDFVITKPFQMQQIYELVGKGLDLRSRLLSKK